MRPNRRTRLHLALVSLLALLFMQLSVAAYACADMRAAAGGDPTPVHEAMVDCEDMDAEQLLLCHAHCHAQSATSDIPVPAPVALPGFDLAGTAALVRSLHPVAQDNPTSPDILARTTAPPIPVANCCYRN